MNVTLRRVGLAKDATYGVLVRDDTQVAFAITLERDHDGGSNRPSDGDKPGACIPAGVYSCLRTNSPKFGNTFEVMHIPNRSKILFHAGNLAADSRGCILVGHGFDPVNGTHGIVSSKKEFAEFLALQADVMGFTLTIVDP